MYWTSSDYSQTKETKVIMMTALSQDTDRQRGESLGVNKYLIKSQVTLEDVVNSVKEELASPGGTTPPAPPAAPPTTPPPTPPAPPAPPAIRLSFYDIGTSPFKQAFCMFLQWLCSHVPLRYNSR